VSLRETRAWRLGAYVQHMLPPATAFPVLAAYALSIHLGLQALAGRGALRITWRAAAAAVSVFLFGLLLRVYDEFKDAESDLALARAGDPRYRDRPIVTGAITLAELKILRWILTAVLVAGNLPLGLPYALPAFAVLWLLAWLSSKWFFWPRIAQSLPLALVTHNPLLLACLGYVAAVYVQDFGPDGLNAWSVPLLIGAWLPWTAWETARKIRIPEDETDYQTYSKILGTRRAPLVPALCVLASVACLAPTLRAAGVGWVVVGVLAVGAGIPLVAFLRFIVAPSRAGARLRPYVDLYSAVVNIGMALALGAHHGIRLG